MNEADSHLTVREIAKRTNIHYSTISRHRKTMGKIKKLDKCHTNSLRETKFSPFGEKLTEKINRIAKFFFTPYSPDLSPIDYHFFRYLNSFLTGKVFREVDVKTAFDGFITSRSPDFFQKSINALISHREKCVEVNGDYFD